MSERVRAADVPVVILAGGRGTRLMEETRTVPKPMVSVGESPIIVHIMRYYAHFGFRRFVVCLGYKGHVIKEYFMEYSQRTSDMVLRMRGGEMECSTERPELDDWEIVLAETGEHSLTARRLHIARRYLDAPVFALTYGDGVCDVPLDRGLEFHLAHGKQGTVTAVHPPSRFGRLVFGDGAEVVSFREKETLRNDFINGGFFFFDRAFLDRLDGENLALESEPLSSLAAEGELCAFRHEGFWQCMDTMRDRQLLEELYETGRAPWHVW